MTFTEAITVAGKKLSGTRWRISLRHAMKIKSAALDSSRPLAASIRCFSSEPVSTPTDNFLSGANSIYVEKMFESWKKDKKSVHASWDAYFSTIESATGTSISSGAGPLPANFFSSPPAPPPVTYVPVRSGGGTAGSAMMAPMANYPVSGAVGGDTSMALQYQKEMDTAASDSLGISYLIRAYQVRGHELANLDPLGLNSFRDITPPPELEPSFHGFNQYDMDRPLQLRGTAHGGHVGYLQQLSEMATTGEPVTLRQILSKLRQTYCSTVGIEYMHMGNRDKCNYIRDMVENHSFFRVTKEEKMHIFERLAFAQIFENFLGTKYNTVKRFGLDGGESVIPGLKALIDRGSEIGISSFVFGMAHRGRLNVLANVMRKPMPLIFKEFQGTHYDMEKYEGHTEPGEDGKPDELDGQVPSKWTDTGDVKYHLGTSMDRTYPDGRTVHLSLVANPSHLEAVDPVVVGKVRAKQFYAGDKDQDKKKVIGVLIHGDAAFAGQGIVYETMQMAKVKDFGVGGTIHVIVNNQVGFTTGPKEGRSTQYASDLAKAFQIPIFHCNGDDPVAVVRAFELAVEWRQHFGEDVLIDMICYRRMGHNELDQPMFTQPLLYKAIKKHPTTLDRYQQTLIDSKVATPEECAEVRNFVTRSYEDDFAAASTYESLPNEWLASRWRGFKSPTQLSRIRKTGLDLGILRRIGDKLCAIPQGFQAHSSIQTIYKRKQKTIEEGKGIDWGTAEALAFGSLLLEGNHVRISGQDVQRGTFSHRHALLHDQNTGEEYIPLNNIAKVASPAAPLSEMTAPDLQAKFVARNSILSEYGVMGFEMGYSLENPNALVLWEAQFGDFVNGAQIMIDQFLSSGESKWMRQCGLVLLLPHGYDGQGAEHSSCRIERFLQMMDDDEDKVPVMTETDRMQIQHGNMQIVNCSTPANYFHLLRRQIHRDFRKPLVVASPKNLLRHARAVSTLEDMGPTTQFQRVIGEQDEAIVNNPDNVVKIIFCTGKLYYELLAERERREEELGGKIAIIRIEQLAPFPYDSVAEEVAQYKNAKTVKWAQEEPKNMGAWAYIKPRLMTATRYLNKDERRPLYAGRAPAAAPATGLHRVHEMGQRSLIAAALVLPSKNANAANAHVAK